MKRKRKPQPRKQHFKPKPSLKVRTKARPDNSKFNVEMILMPVPDVPRIDLRSSQKRSDEYAAWENMINVIRTMCGNHKIVIQRTRYLIKTKVFLENDNDIVMLALANSELIWKTYRYRDVLDHQEG